MTKRHHIILLVLIIVSMLAFSATDSFSSGFGIFTQDSSSTSQASATIAHSDNPSAIFYNPSLINQLTGTQVEAETTLLSPTREFKSALTGQTTKTESQIFFPSTFYVTQAVNDKLSVGFGLFSPFGLGTKWPDNWEGRYIATNSKLTTIAFNPVASVRLAPWITVAGGLVYMYVDTTLERHLNFTVPGLALPDGTQKFHATGSGLGFNAGLLLEPTKDVNIGLSYRSRVRTDLDGNVTFGIPASVAPVLGPLFPNTSATTKLDLPAQAYAGIYFKQLYPLTFEIATRWEQWSLFKQLDLQLGQPVVGSSDVISERNWRDTWSGMIGLKYQLTKPVAILGGYLYQRGAVPASTFEPAIPDSDGHLFTIGSEIKLKSLSLAAGYGYQILKKRTKNNTVDDNPNDGTFNAMTAANGEYKSHLHIASLSITYRF